LINNALFPFNHLIPKEFSDLIAARIAGAKVVVMPGAGHIPFMEQPEEVARHVLDFIDNVSR
jgi:pimeloyl-ACP methyl ester carboxylesterase